MTADTTHDPAKASKLAQQIVSILANEDSVIRQRAIQAALLLLGETTPFVATTRPKPVDDVFENEDTSLAQFFNREGDLKPADYAHLCAAYHFSQFGTANFSVADIRSIASNAGVIIPDRADMTFSNAQKKGKKLFQSIARGIFKPTAAAGLEFKERWGVKPGRLTKDTSSASE